MPHISYFIDLCVHVFAFQFNFNYSTDALKETNLYGKPHLVADRSLTGPFRRKTNRKMERKTNRKMERKKP